MALSVIRVHQTEFDQPDASIATVRPVVIQFDSSYPVGGYPLTPSTFGFTRMFGVLFSAGASARAGLFQMGQDPFSGRIRFFALTPVTLTGPGNSQRAADIGGWSEVASATDLSGIRVRALAVGY